MTLMFGSVAAVLHCDVSPRLIRRFRISSPPDARNEWISVFSRFCSRRGAKLKDAKSEVGQEIAFLGLLGSVPSNEDVSVLSISLPGDKRKASSSLIPSYLESNRLPYQEIEKLIGRMSFSHTLRFGEFARTHILSLCTKLRRKFYNASLSASERATLIWRADSIGESPHWIGRPYPVGSATFCTRMRLRIIRAFARCYSTGIHRGFGLTLSWSPSCVHGPPF